MAKTKTAPTETKRRLGCEIEAAAILVRLAHALAMPAERIRVARIEDRVWEREWLKDFHSMRCGRRLWIVPRHEAAPRDPQAVVVRLDPGLAFGTGTHPSTALCLTWLDAHLEPGARVIDFGCGSGVLAIAAARLGASRAACYDIDPQAGIATRGNAIDNAVAAAIVLFAVMIGCQMGALAGLEAYRSLSTAAMISATRTGSAVAISPPMIEPMGIVPHTMKRIVAFILPWMAVGLMAWRKLTWLTL